MDVDPSTLERFVGQEACFRVNANPGPLALGSELNIEVVGANARKEQVSDFTNAYRYCFRGSNPGVDLVSFQVGNRNEGASVSWLLEPSSNNPVQPVPQADASSPRKPITTPVFRR